MSTIKAKPSHKAFGTIFKIPLTLSSKWRRGNKASNKREKMLSLALFFISTSNVDPGWGLMAPRLERAPAKKLRFILRSTHVMAAAAAAVEP